MDLPSGDREKALVPCRAACPAGVDIPLYVSLLAEGRAAEAAAVVRNRAPLPTVLGHVCHHPCEDECRRGRLSDPVAICDLKRVAGHAVSLPPETNPDTGKTVAVIGGGPAGLSAAFYLRLLGHEVTLYEAEPEMGGKLRYTIPPERLPRDALDWDLAMLLRLGVVFRNGARIGDHEGGPEDIREHHAVVVATGAGIGKSLSLPGADLEGIHVALDYLRSAARGEPSPDVRDRRVVVIGGGGVAMDAASTAARHGAESVDLFCLESPAEMPAHPDEIAAAEALGVRLHPAWGPTEFTSAHSRVEYVGLHRCTAVSDEAGRFAPAFDESHTGRAPADLVFLAVGREPDRSALQAMEALGLPVETAGDLATGPTDVTRSVAEGRRAALAVHARLGFTTPLPEYVPPHPPGGRLGARKGFAGEPRRELPLDRDTAAAEADRCLRCFLRLSIAAPERPPETRLSFDREHAESVREAAGVLVLRDETGRALFIRGTPDLRETYVECLADPSLAAVVSYEAEPDEMYAQRESELLARHLQAHGTMPEAGGGLDHDLS